MVYLIVNEERTVCKIGWTTEIKSRLSSINGSSFYKMYLDTIIEGGILREAEIHQMFDQFRLNGEWFTFDSSIKEYFDMQVDKVCSEDLMANRKSNFSSLLINLDENYEVQFNGDLFKMGELATKLYLALPLFFRRKDKIILVKSVKENISKVVGATVPTIEKAIRELVDRGVIIRTATATYKYK